MSCPAQDAHKEKQCPVSNGAVGRRPTLICPERLKDFGAEEYLNGDVKFLESKVTEAPEAQLMCPVKPSKKCGNVCTSPSNIPEEYLRFEEIGSAAFKIQAGLQKTPCTVSQHLFHVKEMGIELILALYLKNTSKALHLPSCQ